MKKIIILAVFGFVAPPSAAASDWTKEDTAWQTGYLALHVVDWRQTREASAHPERYIETNPVLGERPSQSRVDGYFAATTILHTAVAYALPPKWRRTWQHITIGIEVGAVVNNYSLGLRGSF